MNGYIGTRYKRRRFKRRIYFIVIAIIIFLFTYFVYTNDEDKESITNENIHNNANIEPKVNSISLKEHELKISEKNNQINSLIKKNKLLSESIDLLNFNLEKDLGNFKEIANKEIEDTNAKNHELQKELQSLNSSILELKNDYKTISNDYKTISNDYKTISNEYLKLNLKLKRSEEKVLQSEKLLSEQNKIIQELKDKIHH